MVLNYRTVVAGIDVEVREYAYLEGLFKRLGGKVGEVSDKSIEMRFPTADAAATFKREARARGAIFD